MFLSKLKTSLAGPFFNLYRKNRKMTTSKQAKDRLHGSILFVGAHPDDEAGFYAGAISQLTQSNPGRVYVLSATLGHASTKGSGKGASGGRLEEFRNSLGVLGVPQENGLHLDLPDGQLHQPANIRRLARELARLATDHRLATFITPGREGADGHTDHKAVHIAAVLAARHVQAEVWSLDPYGNGQLTFSDLGEQKREALLSHPSQFPDEQSIDSLIAASPTYAGLMQKEAYRRSNLLDIAQCLFRLVVPLKQHIPTT